MNQLKHLDVDVLSLAAPNIDDHSVSPDDVIELQHELQDVSLAFQRLAQYAEVKALAMKLRLAGNINDAIHHEIYCQSLYERLPDWARW